MPGARDQVCLPEMIDDIASPVGEVANNGKLDELFRRYHRDLLRFVTRLIGSGDTAEDIAQETYLKLAKRRGQGREIERPKAYLLTAARNLVNDHATKRLTKAACEKACGALPEVASEAPMLDAALDARRRLELMAQVLNELPSACREAFVLNKLRGLGQREIAERLDISISMVEKHVIRALTHCRDRLRQADGASPGTEDSRLSDGLC